MLRIMEIKEISIADTCFRCETYPAAYLAVLRESSSDLPINLVVCKHCVKLEPARMAERVFKNEVTN